MRAKSCGKIRERERDRKTEGGKRRASKNTLRHLIIIFFVLSTGEQCVTPT